MAVAASWPPASWAPNTWSGVPIANPARSARRWPAGRWRASMDRAGRRPGLVARVRARGSRHAPRHGRRDDRQLPAAARRDGALRGLADRKLADRYAAADVSPGAQRGRAMGLIVWGSSAGSMLGPNLMEPALRVGNLLGVVPAASAFLISLGGYALAAIVIEILLRPDSARDCPRDSRDRGGQPSARAGPFRSGAILGDVRVQLALATLTISQFRDDQHHVDVAGLSARSGLRRADHRPRGVPAPRRHVRGFTAVRLALRSRRAPPMIGVGAMVLVGRGDGLAGLAPGSGHVLVIWRWRSTASAGTSPCRRQRAPDRRLDARRARVDARARRSGDGSHGRPGIRRRRHDPGRVGLRRPQRESVQRSCSGRWPRRCCAGRRSSVEPSASPRPPRAVVALGLAPK